MNYHKRILITGAARSGTKYTAELLSQLSGLPVSHEEIFGLHANGPDGLPLRSPTGEVITKSLDPNGDPPSWGDFRIGVSWLAAPFLNRLPDDILTIHQVRHPIHAIRSIYRRKFLREGNPYGEFVRMALAGQAYVWDPWPWPDNLASACRYWIRWNEMISDAGTHLWWRVEDIRAGTWILEPLLEHVVGDVREPVSHLDRIDVPTNLNTGNYSRESELPGSLKDIPAAFQETVWELAKKFGYEL